jgi:hypothetical protein
MPAPFSCAAGCALVVGLTLGACSPEVLIASNEGTAGSGGVAGGAGVAGTAGTGGSGGSGGSEPVPGEAGQGGSAPEPPRILADSVADFSKVQGQHGWYYGYDDGTSASYAPMTRMDVITTYEPPTGDQWDCWVNDTVAHWTQIFQLGAHANGTNTSAPSEPLLQRAVRRWLSNYEGDVKISGEVAKIDVGVSAGANGVEALIVVDGVELDSFVVGAEDTGGWSYEVPAHVNVGSTVDFVLDPFESNDHHDLTRFTGIIERVVTPPGP